MSSTLDPPSSDGTRAKLLLVDDTYANLVALTAVLEPLDQELVTARSGEEALRRLLVADFAVILLDVHMPGLDGFQTATLIRKRERSRCTPIIFLTAHLGQPRHVFEGYAHGAVDYLVKPYDADVLCAKVRALVDLHLSRERVKREAEYARRRERLEVERTGLARQQRWMDAVPHPIWIVRPDGATEMVNARWSASTGLDLDDTQRHGWMRAIAADERDDVERRWVHGLRSCEPFDLEVRMLRRDGRPTLHGVRCVPELDDARRATTWICTATAREIETQSPRTAETVPALGAAREREREQDTR